MKSLAVPISCVALATVLASACQGEPERNCGRVRFGWPLLDFDPSVDVDAQADGLQVDFDVNSDLAEGATALLTVTAGESDPIYAGQAQAGDDGLLSFRGITVPDGDIVFFVEASDSCGRHRSGARTFVWDGLGFPTCDLRLGSEPAPDGDSPFPVLRAENDEDPELVGMQVRVLVEAGRPDMRVSLFALDRESGETQSLDLAPDESGLASTTLTLGAGEQALRAVCFWDEQGLRPSSPTWTYLVELDE